MTSSNSTHNITRMPTLRSYVRMMVMTTQRVKSLMEMYLISPIDKGASVCDYDCVYVRVQCVYIAFCIYVCMCESVCNFWCCSCVKSDVWCTPVRSTLLSDVMQGDNAKKPKLMIIKRGATTLFAIVIKYANIRSSNLQIRWLTNHTQFQAKQRHDTRTKHATTAARQLVAAAVTTHRFVAMYVQNT